ncbi:MAG: type I-C CRISPR-associated protein Cas8c/Csd1 [Gemmatimonadota bacterium]
MILEALNRLAEAEGLMEDPDYEMKPVAWLVRVAPDGTGAGLLSTRYTPEPKGKKKPKPVAKPFSVPRQPGRTSGDRAFFLCDKAEYVLGRDPSGERDVDKLAMRATLFRDLVRACAEATHDEGMNAVASVLERVALGELKLELPSDCAPNDLFAFVYAPDEDVLVHHRTAVRAYWKEQRSTAPSADRGRTCLITGDPISESALFPTVKGVPGGSSAGVALVSFNANAFESYGWKGSENAPLSRGAAEAAATALNRLLHQAYPDPRIDSRGSPLPRRNLLLGAGTVLCYWAPDAEPGGLVDAFAGLLQADPEQVPEALRCIWTGKSPHIDDAAHFYALVLSGAQGRAMIRDWLESSVSRIAENLARYFEDLDIVRNTPKPKDRELPPNIPLDVLLSSLAPFGDRKRVPSALAAQLVGAAIRGERLPLSALQRAVERTRAEVGRTDWLDLSRRDARAAIIKAVLRRNTSHTNLTPAMDPSNTQPGYLLGRLIAVLERLQQIALGDVNATVIDRFFGAASASPQSVFPRLLKNARHHARKAQDNDRQKGNAIWLDRQIDEVLAPLGVEQHRQGLPFTGFPRHLNLEQQGLFVLGYHQQRHWLYMKREDRHRIEQERAAAIVE